MSARTTRFAAALVAGGALVLGLNGLTAPTQAAPNFKNAPTVQLDAQAGSGVLRARPHGSSVVDQEYFTVKMPADGNYHVTMTGFVIPDTSPAFYQCLVVDKNKALVGDVSGYYLLESYSSDMDNDLNLDIEIDVNLKKGRALIIGCSTSVELQTPQPISYTFKKNGGFTNLNTNVFTVREGARLPSIR
jgi:hypothetical protein